jgi:signal transduction histidine kinase
VAVAADLKRVSAAAMGFAKDLAIALTFLGLILAAATLIQIRLGLRPLDALRRGISDIRAGRLQHLPAEVPSEVRPLVEEVNALLDAQEQEIERSRGRAADLAHGLKTPLAALVADAVRLRERGEQEIAQDIEAVGDAMTRHVDRELARVRARGAVRHRPAYSTKVAPLVRSLIATLSRTPAGMRVTFEPRVAEDMQVPLDRTDLAEVLGNVLENAARHASKRVRITAEGGSDPSIITEDDGAGIQPAQWPRVLERGVRLDERGEGAGLGLSIVQDVLKTYHWKLDLDKSELGGLKVTVAPSLA